MGIGPRSGRSFHPYSEAQPWRTPGPRTRQHRDFVRQSPVDAASAVCAGRPGGVGEHFSRACPVFGTRIIGGNRETGRNSVDVVTRARAKTPTRQQSQRHAIAAPRNRVRQLDRKCRRAVDKSPGRCRDAIAHRRLAHRAASPCANDQSPPPGCGQWRPVDKSLDGHRRAHGYRRLAPRTWITPRQRDRQRTAPGGVIHTAHSPPPPPDTVSVRASSKSGKGSARRAHTAAAQARHDGRSLAKIPLAPLRPNRRPEGYRHGCCGTALPEPGCRRRESTHAVWNSRASARAFETTAT